MQKILSRMSFIGFGIQIVLGILWMCNAFARLEGPGEGIVCVGAMLLLGAAALFCKRSIWGEDKLWSDVFVVASVLTFPFVMQSLVYPDRRILVTGALLFGAGAVLRVMGSVKGAKKLVAVFAFWIAAGGVIVGAESLGREKGDVSTRLTERIIWTTMQNTFARVSEETKDAIPYEKFSNATYEVTGIEEILLPALIDRHGAEGAERIMDEFRATAWQYGKGQIIKEIIWDGAGYTLSPVVVPLQLGGRAYESYTGLNYRELLGPAPQLGKFYTYYSCWWFVVSLVCGALSGIIALIKSKKAPAWRRFTVMAVPALGMIAGYTLNGAGRMDYKNTLYVLCIWLIWAAGMVVQVRTRELNVYQMEGRRNEKE